MFKIKTLSRISPAGLNRFPLDSFEVASEIEHPDAMLVRSTDLHGMELPPSLKAVARAGAGINNIPVDACTARGIVVFNTPGANANSVKELVLAGLLISSRRILEGVSWTRGLSSSGGEVADIVEKGKTRFKGPEIKGKTLGVVGLGAVGVLVANDAVSLGMDVIGYDPFISIESAWGLSRDVKRSALLDGLIEESDYITLHLPLSDKTRHMIDQEKFARMKKGVRLLNLARGGLVATKDLLDALNSGTVDYYVTDFPENEIVGHEKVLSIPHLGASTPEAEENCAVMAADQLVDFLMTGNVRNSVNYPTCNLAPTGDTRIVIANRNVPNMVGQITTVLAQETINISDMLNRHLGNYAYNIIDMESSVAEDTIQKLAAIDGVVMVRLIDHGQNEE